MENDLNIENLISDIDNKYKELEQELGWSFLVTSKENLKKNCGIALITLNPGGCEKADSMGYFETGNAYCDEDWFCKKGEKETRKGQAPLQIQIQELFKKLATKNISYPNYINLMNNSLMGYFIPFRSQSISSLKNANQSREFGKKLWSNILENVDLKLIICIDKNTYSSINEIICGLKYIKYFESELLPTGWGNINSEVRRYKKENKSITIARLPHLSRYRIFNRGNPKFDSLIEDIIM